MRVVDASFRKRNGTPHSQAGCAFGMLIYQVIFNENRVFERAFSSDCRYFNGQHCRPDNLLVMSKTHDLKAQQGALISLRV